MCDKTRPRVMVAQIGSRLNYLVPRVLANRKMLGRFATDLWCPRWLSRSWLANVANILGGRAQAIWGRRDNVVPDQLVYHFPLFSWQYLRHKAEARRQGDIYRAYSWGGKRFAELCAKIMDGAVQCVYAFTSAAQELFEAAKDKGKLCVLDHASGFVTIERELYNQHWERYPEWGNPRGQTDGLFRYADRQYREIALADLILAPSSFARECILRAGAPPDKVVVLPLAFEPHPSPPEADVASGKPLKILFAARQALLKGLPDLLEALRLLPSREYHARVAGIRSVPEAVRTRVPSNVEFLGEVRRSEMPRHYAWADIFVLPTVCDTFGLVILEAMSHGVPVIATERCAAPDIIREGQEGFFVPVANPEYLAQCLERVNSDRSVLQALKSNAYRRAKEFTEETYADRLVQFLDTIAASISK